MNVLILPGYFGFGGAVEGPGTSFRGVFFRDQATALAAAGHSVGVMYVHFDATNKRTRVETTVEEGVRYTYIHAVPWPKLNSIQRMVLLARYAKEAFNDAPPEVVHAHVFTALPQAWLLSKLLGVPYVVTEHSSTVRKGALTKLWRVVARFGYSRATAVLAVSKPLAAAVQEVAEVPVQIVSNAVRDEFFDVPLKDRSGVFQFVSVGNSHPDKGWDQLLRVFADLIHQQVDARLILVGSATSFIMSLVDELGLQEHVVLCGKVQPNRVREILAGANCNVMPSRIETFGIGSIEALAAGLPVIMTRTDAADVIVTANYGITVPIGDRESLRRAMLEMMHSHGRYIGVDIREDARRRFSGQALVRELQSVYEQAVRRDRGI